MSPKVEVTILSAENLSIDGKPVKKDTYVVVELDSSYSASTKADYQGGSNPTWNQRLEIDMPKSTRVIKIEVKCKTGSRDKQVGTIGIPISDFIGDYTPENYLHFLSYRLRDSRGERNGIINVSVRVDAPAWACSSSARTNMGTYNNSGFSSSAWRRTVGVPVGVGRTSHYGGVVTGVPVWCGSRA